METDAGVIFEMNLQKRVSAIASEDKLRCVLTDTLCRHCIN